MKLAIILAVHNGLNHTLDFLKQLDEQTNRDFTVILVDDGSVDGTSEIVRRNYPECTIIHGDGNWWWTKSTNVAIKEALDMSSDAILIMNNDSFIEKDYIQNVHDAIQKNPKAIIGSMDITYEEPKRIFFSGIKKIHWWKAKSIAYHNTYVPYNPAMTGLHKSICLNGRGTIIPAYVFKEIALLDEINLPQYASDFDFTIRADRAGIPCYISWDLKVYSIVGTTGAGKPFIKQSLGKFIASYFRKNSQTNITGIYRYYRNHCKWYYLHLAVGMQILRYLYSYFKRNNSFVEQLTQLENE